MAGITKIATGKITRTAKGKIIKNSETYTIYTDNLTLNSGGPINLTTDGEMIFGNPEKPTSGGKYIMKGEWTSDREGKKPVTKAKLGEEVFFHIETKNIPNFDPNEKDSDKSRIFFQCYNENQSVILGLDYLSPDEKVNIRKHSSEEYYISENVKDNKVVLGGIIFNGETAVDMIKNDDTPGDVELYFRVEYKPKNGANGPVYERINIPNSFSDYLRLGLPDIPDLYFIQPSTTYQFPEIRTQEGNVLFMQFLIDGEDYTEQKSDKAVEVVKSAIAGKVKKGAIEVGEVVMDNLKERSYVLAMRELEKGSIMYGSGKVIQRKNVYDKDIRMIDGNVRSIKRASNTGFRIEIPESNGKTQLISTKGLNQLEVFSQQNPVYGAANFGAKVFQALNCALSIKDMADSMQTGKPDYNGMSSLLISFFPTWISYLSIPVSLIVNEASKNFEEMEDEAFWEVFMNVREEGMDAMKQFLDTDPNIQNNNRDSIIKNRLTFLSISAPTLQKLLAKEFKTFKDLENEAYKDSKTLDTNNGLVIKRIYNQDYQRDDHFIYCIFINEKNLE